MSYDAGIYRNGVGGCWKQKTKQYLVNRAKKTFSLTPFITLNSYDSWVKIVEIGGTGLSTSYGADSATVSLHQDSSYGTYYNVRYDDSTEQYIVRDQAYHDGWMWQCINGYTKPMVLGWHPSVFYVQIGYEVIGQREDSSHAIENLKYRFFDSDDYWGNTWYMIDSDAVSSGTWWDGYNCVYDATLNSRIASGKYIK